MDSYCRYVILKIEELFELAIVSCQGEEVIQVKPFP